MSKKILSKHRHKPRQHLSLVLSDRVKKKLGDASHEGEAAGPEHKQEGGRKQYLEKSSLYVKTPPPHKRTRQKELFESEAQMVVEPFHASKIKAKPRKLKSPVVASATRVPAKSKPTLFARLWKHWLLALNLAVIGVCGWEYNLLLLPKPGIIATYPREGAALKSYDQPITYEFNVPIDTSKLALNFAPDLPGKVVYEKYVSWLPLARKVKFYPEQTLSPGGSVMSYLAYIANPVYPKPGNEFELNFKAVPVPAVASTSLPDNANNVLTNASLIFNLSSEDGKQVAWQAQVVPPVDFSLEPTNALALILKFAKPLSQGTVYDVKLLRSDVIYDIATGQTISQTDPAMISEVHFTTVRAPFIQSFAPQGNNIHADHGLAIVFDDAMDQTSVTSAISLTPATQGTWQWQADGKTLTFTPQAWQKATDYKLAIASGAKNSHGGRLEAEVDYLFTTIGAAKIVGQNPASGVSNVGLQPNLVITFDQPMEHASAQGSFSLTPAVAGNFGWNGNTMTFSPSTNLSFLTTYTYQLAAGVISTYGLPMTTAFQSSFTTLPPSVKLSVPLYLQDHSGDGAWYCNLVAARMLLAYHGVYVSNAQIRAGVGDAGTYNAGSGNNGDPHKGFVNGYGTYWEPISTYVGSLRSTKMITGTDLTALLTEVQNGNPVETWGQNGFSTPTPMNWTAKDGVSVLGVSGMHSVVVTGYDGTPTNPTKIYVNDPWLGYRTLSPAQFKSMWSWFGVAMVVY